MNDIERAVEALERIEHSVVAYKEHTRRGSLPKLDSARLLLDAYEEIRAVRARLRRYKVLEGEVDAFERFWPEVMVGEWRRALLLFSPETEETGT